MIHQCIEMNYNSNCIFGDITGHRECDKIKGHIIGRSKPCESCEVTVYWWELKDKELAVRNERVREAIRMLLK